MLTKEAHEPCGLAEHLCEPRCSSVALVLRHALPLPADHLAFLQGGILGWHQWHLQAAAIIIPSHAFVHACMTLGPARSHVLVLHICSNNDRFYGHGEIGRGLTVRGSMPGAVSVRAASAGTFAPGTLSRSAGWMLG